VKHLQTTSARGSWLSPLGLPEPFTTIFKKSASQQVSHYQPLSLRRQAPGRLRALDTHGIMKIERLAEMGDRKPHPFAPCFPPRALALFFQVGGREINLMANLRRGSRQANLFNRLPAPGK
jgi:hypothetical protein